jgi:hypothetical protein
MNKKKMYLVKLAEFLVANNMSMSGNELVDHLKKHLLMETANLYGIHKIVVREPVVRHNGVNCILCAVGFPL